MKLFLSADIEGTAGITCWDETEYGHSRYGYFAEQMTKEVSAACAAADRCGYEILVKDAHDSAKNILPDKLHPSATLIRGWARDINCMMSGIDTDKFDAVAFTGYHSPAMSEGNSLAHTMTTSIHSVKINGKYASEFTINAYIAAMYGIPVVFLSGDEAMCESAKELIPGITTVATKRGFGAACISQHPDKVCAMISRGMEEALSKNYKKTCKLKLPEHFSVEITYRDVNDATGYSCYPGVVRLDAKTLLYENDSYIEVLRMMHFIM
ncbi:MAG: M55 family metallopeptidase [Clostridia bacterium]|nr:M55 family metallopeptidase [Clostridia bacterium]